MSTAKQVERIAAGIVSRLRGLPHETGLLVAERVRQELPEVQQEHASALLREGWTFAALGEALGIRRQVAHKRFGSKPDA